MAVSKIKVNISLRFNVWISYVLIKLGAPKDWVFKAEV